MTNWIGRRWRELEKLTDAELLAAYRHALDDRQMSEPQRSANIRAFGRIASRQDRIYFIVSSEAIMRHKRQH